ncbi:ABC-type sugar transport system permease subunit [Hydrogenispora ethanolica]|uniref:ABC-type sugar transport system permease subunit n=1 Tax=Hydrogenispora ethanolica TaxID=1082276 RepID=A0A4R1S0M5_HYDET|nr:sugar ABC transporter permease [Hydrogenispora ethanolica]TCL72404.1 ABC-type sugar transport system permease subunit [Hydrogenispora ethanolica]
MVATKQSKAFYFILFLLPALLLYGLFFIGPFCQGIQYSFTDWNGIVPEIPFIISRTDFQTKIVAAIGSRQDLRYLQRYYRRDDSGENYRLTNWIQERGVTRQLNRAERSRIKRILASVGIRSIHFIGFENYRQMFQSDERFVPRLETKFLFNEFDDLPPAIPAKDFHQYLLPHLTRPAEKTLVLSHYRLHRASHAYRLSGALSDAAADRLRNILSKRMYATLFIPGVIGFTLFFTVLNVIFSNLLALILALVLDTRLKTKNLLRSIFFFPNVLSLVIVAFIWSFVFRLIFPPLTGISVWLGSPDLAPYALLMVTVWQGCGWLMIIYLAGLQTIPVDILEVAAIDGAGWWQRLRHITVPLLIPAFTICTFFSLANSLKTFDVIMALTQGGPGYVTTPIVLDIYYDAFRNNQFGYATAKAVFLCLMIMIVTGVQLYFMKRREMEL